PVGAVDAVELELVRAGHDEEAVERGGSNGVEHARQELGLLRRIGAVARRGSGCEDDAVDRQEQPASAAQRCWTFAMYVCVACVGARPSRSTTVGPALYAASARSVRSKRFNINFRYRAPASTFDEGSSA